jgi:intracellular multiplication protein IcmP
MSAGNNQGDPSIVLILVLVLFAGLGWLFWHITHDFWLDHFFRWLRYVELWVIDIFVHRYGACLDWLRYAQVSDPDPSPNVIKLTNECFSPQYLNRQPINVVNSYYQLSTTPIVALGALTATYYRWPLAVALGLVIFYETFFASNNKFMNKHNLESMIETQAKMWPIITPIVKFNPSKTGRILGDAIPDKLPLFAEALSPEEWIAWNNIPIVNGIPDRDATRRAFIRQLGPRWNGIESTPLHIQALLAAFALKGAQKREDSDDFLGRLAASWSPEKGFRPDSDLIGEIGKILRDPEIGGKIVPITDKFAWRTTAVLGALQWARSLGGVLAPASFLWVRAEDRALWYPLNNLGRRSFHSEGAGAMAHLMAEQAAQKPLAIPRVDTAIVTLNTYLHDPDKRSIPIPPRADGAKV